MKSAKQKTIQKEIVFSGSALFTQQHVSIKLLPAGIDEGVVFCRKDLPNAPSIFAKTAFVQDGMRTTKLGNEQFYVQTVEHLMAAIYALEIDNITIEITGSEVPIMDGSSLAFVQLLKEAGVVSQEKDKKIYALKTACSVSMGDSYLIALPSENLKISYVLDYPHSPYLRSQYFDGVITPTFFEQEIAPCRTFALYEEIVPLIEKGFFKNGALDQGVVIQHDRVLNPEGVRFPNEMARHKVLDLLGDIALIGHPLQAHLIGIKTGHALNHALGRAIIEQMSKSFEEI